MLEQLFNQTSAPTLERAAGFYAARHKLLADNVVNLSTPGYRQKDLDEAGFHRQLQDRLDARDRSTTHVADLDGVGVDGGGAGNPGDTLVFHDGNDRDVEGLITEQAKNALQHNLAIELLRKQFNLFDLALRERVG